jgi:hypothetical protein
MCLFKNNEKGGEESSVSLMRHTTPLFFFLPLKGVRFSSDTFAPFHSSFQLSGSFFTLVSPFVKSPATKKKEG